MFSKNASQDSIKTQGEPTTLIAEGSKITGDLIFNGNLEIQGSIVGKIISDDDNSQVRVLHGASVLGSVSAPNVIINGHIKGDIFALKHARLASQAVVEGNLYYNTLEIERGAHVAGNLVHELPATNVSVLAQDDISKNSKA